MTPSSTATSTTGRRLPLPELNLSYSATTRLKSCVGIRGIALESDGRDCRKVAVAIVGHDGCRSRGVAGSENPGVTTRVVGGRPFET